MKTIQELHILVGLPGSGKTTFANKNKAENIGYRFRYNNKADMYADVIDFDKIYNTLGKNPGSLTDKDKLEKMVIPYIRNEYIIVDGYFPTQEEIEWVLNIFFGSERFIKHFKVKKIVIDYWYPNIEICLWNDRGRRDQNSITTIKNTKLVKPDLKRIEDIFNIPTKLNNHEIVRKPDYLVFASEKGLRVEDEKYLKSSTWSLGGTGHSWNGDTYNISAEEPSEFTELDDLLEMLCPAITYLHYKKMFSRCVTMDSQSSSDYYSNTQEGFYRCDVEKLYEILTEFGYIESL